MIVIENHIAEGSFCIQSTKNGEMRFIPELQIRQRFHPVIIVY